MGSARASDGSVVISPLISMVFGSEGAQHLDAFLDDGGQHGRRQLLLAFPAEREDLLHQVLAPLRGMKDPGEMPLRLAAGRGVLESEVGKSKDRSEDVVEIMRDAG